MRSLDFPAANRSLSANPKGQPRELRQSSGLARMALGCLGVFALGVVARLWEMHSVSVPKDQRLLPRVSIRAPYDPGQDCSKNRRTGDIVNEVPRSHIRSVWVHRTHNVVSMATLARLPGGRWVAAWQESEGEEGEEGQRIAVSFSLDSGGLKWGKPSPVFGARNDTSQNSATRVGADWGPVLHCCTSDGKLLLFFSRSSVCSYEAEISRKTYDPAGFGGGFRDVMETTQAGLRDGGKPRKVTIWSRGGSIMSTEWSEESQEWSVPTLIDQQREGSPPKMTGTSLLVTASGSWLLPYWQEPPAGNTTCLGMMSADVSAASGVLVSQNGGRDWTAGGVVGRADTHLYAVEPSMVESAQQGRLLMLLGTNAGHIHSTASSDGGATWQAPVPLELLDPGLPGVKPHAIRLADGMLAMGYNDMHYSTRRLPDYKGAATNLFVAVSSTDGKTWMKVARLEDQVERGLQMKNPTLAQAGCNLYIIYSKSYGREFMGEADGQGMILGIKLSVINLKQLG